MALPSVCRVLLIGLLLMQSLKNEEVIATDLGSVVSLEFFLQIISDVSITCPGWIFYGYVPFIAAANAFSAFLTTGSLDVAKREVAAFFAHVAHETGGWCYIAQRNPTSDYCDPSYTQYPCAPGVKYYGRGALQLTWNYNYGAAGAYLGFDGLANPELVETDPLLSFKTAVWFWVVHSDCHKAITSGLGFGATIKAINSKECNGGNPTAVSNRVEYYKSYCSALGVDPGSNLGC